MYVRKIEVEIKEGKIRLENLTPKEAENLGYMARNEASTTEQHDSNNFKGKHTKTICYVNSNYYCTATTHTSIWKILERFENNVKNKKKYI